MNKAKGVVYNRDLTHIQDQEILVELKNQFVIDINRIKKYKNNEPYDTGLFILTFSTATLPEYINIGYEKTKITPYIPQPLRCKTCLHFGHPTKSCKKTERICANCNQIYHFKTENATQERCKNQMQCTNSKSNEHNSFSKICPVYKKMKEITKIKTIENTDYKTAKYIYNQRYQNINENKMTYAQAANSINKEANQSDRKNTPTNSTPTNLENKTYENPKFKTPPTPPTPQAKTQTKNKTNLTTMNCSSDTEHSTDQKENSTIENNPIRKKRGRKPNNTPEKQDRKKQRNQYKTDSEIEIEL